MRTRLSPGGAFLDALVALAMLRAWAAGGATAERRFAKYFVAWRRGMVGDGVCGDERAGAGRGFGVGYRWKYFKDLRA